MAGLVVVDEKNIVDSAPAAADEGPALLQRTEVV